MQNSYQSMLEDKFSDTSYDDPIWGYNDKISARVLAIKAGISVPTLIDGPKSIHALSTPKVNCVLKPVNGCSSKGVFPLLVGQKETYYNIRTHNKQTWTDIKVSALSEKHTKRNIKLLSENHPDALRPPWFIEELIEGKETILPDDFKAWVIGGQVQVIGQYRRVKRNVYTKWYNRQWEVIGDIRPVKNWKYTPNMSAPVNKSEMLSAFEKISTYLPTNMVRVDLYESRQEVPIFGEVTPFPSGGSVRFIDLWDRKLGDAWIKAISKYDS